VDLSVLPLAIAFRLGAPRVGHSGIDWNLAAVHGSHITAFLSYSVVTQLAMPLAPIHIANGLCLIVKGFNDPQPAGGGGPPTRQSCARKASLHPRLYAYARSAGCINTFLLTISLG
jgi:hypothetical protein